MTKHEEITEDLEEVLVEHKAEGVKVTLLGRLRNYFLAGILVTAPISITLYVTWGFLNFLDRKITPLVPDVYNPNSYFSVYVPGLGLIIAVLFFVLVGFLTRNFFGRLLVRFSENIVARLPVINTIYGAVKQIFETVMASKSDAFKEVVMFEYPRKGVWAMGFVTGVSKGEVQSLTNEETVNVFLPTTPNPTSGFLLFIPKKDLIYMKMAVEDGIKLIVSGGIITPPETNGVNQRKE